MKKTFLCKFRKAVAMLVVTTIFLATLVSVVPVSAETATSYNGTIFENEESVGRNGYVTTKRYQTEELVEGLNVYATDFTAVEGMEYTPDTYPTGMDPYAYWSYGNYDNKELTADDGIDLSSDGAIMFYVKLPRTQGETKLAFKFESFVYDGYETEEIKNSHRKWHVDQAATARDYYLFEMGGNEWQSLKTEVLGVGAETSVAKFPAVVLPAGYEGWVRFPVANYSNVSYLDDEAQKFYRIDFYTDILSSEGIQIGAVMAVDNANENLTQITMGDAIYNMADYAAYKATALSAAEFTGNDEYTLANGGTSNAQTAGLFGNGTSFDLDVLATEDTQKTYYSDAFYNADFVPYIYSGSAIRTGGSAWGEVPYPWITFDSEFGSGTGRTFRVLADSADANVVDGVYTQPEETFRGEKYYATLGFKEDGTANGSTDYTIPWKNGNSFIFYVENTGVTLNKISLSMTESPWVHLNKDKNYYLLSETSASWKEGTTVAVHNHNRGYIELPAGFKGWVRIPCENFLNYADKAVTDSTVKKIQLYFAKLGGDYGEINIGQFGIVEGTENLTYISSSYSDNKPVSMIKAPYTVTKASGLSTSYRPLNATTCPLTVTGDTTNLTTTIALNTASTSEYITDGVYTIENPLSANVYAIIQYSTAPVLKTTGSLMMYINHTDSTSAVKIAVGNEWYVTHTSRPYYIMAKNSNEWQEYTTETVNTNKGYVEIPAGFEGWLHIPATTLRKGNTEYTTDKAVAKVYVFPSAIGGEYGSLTISDVSVVEETDARYYFNLGETYTDLAGTEVSADLFKEMLAYDVAVTEGKVTSSALALRADVTDTVLDTANGIMFYAKTTDAANLKLALSNTNTTVDSFAYSYIEYNGLWTEQTSTDGTIALPADFEGWVRLDSTAFTSSEVEFIAVGFGATANCTVSDFMVISLATLDLDYVIIGGEKHSLFVELYDANADGKIDIRDLVCIKNVAALIDGAKAPAIAADIDRSGEINAEDTTFVMKRLLNGPEEEVSELALSRYLAEEGYTTEATYTNNTATVENVNF